MTSRDTARHIGHHVDMHVDKLPSGRWRVRVSHDGRRAAGTADTRVDAQVLGGELLAQLGAVSGDDVTLGAFLLQHVKRATLSPSTADDYERVVRRLVDSEHPVADMLVRSITTAHLVRLYDELLEQGWSGHRVSRLHEVIGGAYKRARRHGIVTVNPASGAAPARPRKPEITPPTAEEVVRLLDAAGEFSPALTLLAMTGMRRGELVGLRWSDVDLDGATLTIRRAVVCTTKTGVVVRDSVKNGPQGERVIALDPHTVAEVREYRRKVTEFYAKLRHPFSEEQYLFGDRYGRPRRPDWATQRFDRLRDRLGLQHVRLYDLRHFMVTAMLAAGAPPTVVAGRAGHDVMTMMRRYVHFIPASDREQANAFAASVLGARQPAK
jgi:integrase